MVGCLQVLYGVADAQQYIQSNYFTLKQYNNTCKYKHRQYMYITQTFTVRQHNAINI